MPDLEERTIADLPKRCENCGTELTEAEKSLALELGSTPVLCSVCAAELEPASDAGELDSELE